MKNAVLSILLFVPAIFFGQAPQYINYQGMARQVNGEPVASQSISLKFDIHQSSATGSVVYSEKQENMITTNALGLFTTRIGVNGTLSFMNWQTGPYFLEVSIDEKGGTNYTSLGTPQQLLSVPFALHAQSVPASYSANVLTIGTNTLTMTQPTPVTISAGNNMSVSPGPDYTISAIPTLTLSANSQSLSISGGNSILLPVTNLTVGSSGLASVSPSTGTNFTVDVPLPAYNNTTGVLAFGANNTTVAPKLTFGGGILQAGPSSNTVMLPALVSVSATPGGMVSVTGGPANYAVTVPQSSLILNNNNLSISGGNVVILPTAHPQGTVTQSGLALVTSLGTNSFNVNVPVPTYNQFTGNLVFGTNSIVVTPTLTISGSTIFVGPSSNSVNISNGFPWKQAVSAVTLATGSDRVGIGTNSAPGAKLDVQGDNALTVPVIKVINSNAANPSAAVDITSNANANPGLFVTNTSGGGVAGSFNSLGGYALYAQNSSNSFHTLFSTNTNLTAGAYAGYFAGGIVAQGKNSGSGDFNFRAQNSGSADLFVVRNDGNVGIGTNVPTGKFHTDVTNGFFKVSDFSPGAGPIANTILLAELTGKSGNGPQLRFQALPSVNFMDIGQNANGDFIVEGTDVQRLTVQNTGNVGIGVPSPAYRLDVTSTNFNLLNLTTTGLNSNVNVDANPTGNGNLQIRVAGGVNNGFSFVTNGVQRMGIDGSGRIGINVSNPTASLQVNGTVRIIDGTEGNGKVLTSDVNGNATWQSVGGGGWSITGNSGTNPATNFFGTSDGQPLSIRTNSLERIIITSGGNVGIGNGLAPVVPLLVKGQSANLGVLKLFNNNGSGGDQTFIGFNVVNDGNDNNDIARIGSIRSAGGGLGRLYFTTGGFGSQVERMRIDEFGNVGIGTSSPAADSRLHLASTTLNVMITADGATQSLLRSNVAGITKGYVGYIAQGTGGMGFMESSGSFARFLVTDIGRVGIGTTSPSASLHVAGNVRIVDGSEGTGKVLTSDINGNASWQTGASGSVSVCVIKDVKPTSTGGGGFTSGAWRTRDLNTVEGNTVFVSLSSNQFTLQPGTYFINAQVPAWSVVSHQAKLKNISDNNDAIIGQTAWAGPSPANVHNHSVISGVITITAAKVFEIQHQCQSTFSPNGFGSPSTGFVAAEVYTTVQIMKLN